MKVIRRMLLENNIRLQNLIDAVNHYANEMEAEMSQSWLLESVAHNYDFNTYSSCS